uniref:Reverse transcriptase n=1 Tax=Cannabis sativa TaxID=3483 RepID=A0A803PH38_CANSA
MVSFEILHYLKRKQQGKEGVMALDLSKAFDRIEWSYLCAMMIQIGFDDCWVELIKQCLVSVKYKVICGDYETNFFLICAEGLSAIIHRYEQRGWIHGFRVARGAPVVSYLFFADNSYLYRHANMGEASKYGEEGKQWIKPYINMIKVINVNGVIFSQAKCFGFGLVARDHEGILIESFQDSRPCVVPIVIAEAIVIKEVLS